MLLERIGLECEGYVRMLCTCTAHRQAIKGLYFYLFFVFANVSKNIHSVGVCMNMYVCVQDSLITIRLASAGVGKKKTQKNML